MLATESLTALLTRTPSILLILQNAIPHTCLILHVGLCREGLLQASYDHTVAPSHADSFQATSETPSDAPKTLEHASSDNDDDAESVGPKSPAYTTARPVTCAEPAVAADSDADQTSASDDASTTTTAAPFAAEEQTVRELQRAGSGSEDDAASVQPISSTCTIVRTVAYPQPAAEADQAFTSDAISRLTTPIAAAQQTVRELQHVTRPRGHAPLPACEAQDLFTPWHFRGRVPVEGSGEMQAPAATDNSQPDTGAGGGAHRK